MGNESGLASEEVASGFLPQSLFDQISDQKDTVSIVFSVFLMGNLFSLDEEESSGGFTSQVGSPVVSMSVPGQSFQNLEEPVTVTVRISVEVHKRDHIEYINVGLSRYVSNHFRTSQTHGAYPIILNCKVLTKYTLMTNEFYFLFLTSPAWITDGCTTQVDTENRNTISCLCDHLTNFACLVVSNSHGPVPQLTPNGKLGCIWMSNLIFAGYLCQNRWWGLRKE